MKRQRYVATLASGREVHVLAYEHGRACALADQHYPGQVVDVGLFQRPQRPPQSWRIDNVAVTEAKAFFDLKLPVQIKKTSRQGGRRGAYDLRLDAHGRAYHHITMKSWQTAAQAGECLWHELTHAAQYERVIGDARGSLALDRRRAWRNANVKGTHYKSRAIEVEAKASEAYNTACPLVR